MRLVLCLLLIVGLRAEAIELLNTDISNANTAKSFSGCVDLKLSRALLDKYDTDSILNNETKNPLPFSKIKIAVSLNDFDYIKNNASSEGIFEALQVTMSSDMEMFDKLLNLIPDNKINTPSKLGGTYLMYATMCNQEEAVNTFLRRGANPNLVFQGGMLPVLIAVIQNNENIVTSLIEYGAKCKIDPTETYLTDIAKNNKNQQLISVLNDCLNK